MKGRFVCAAIALAFSLVSAGAQGATARPPVSFIATALSGDTVRVGHGRPTIVGVFATWCTTCKTEFAELSALARDLGSRVAVVALSVDQGPSSGVRRFVDDRRVSFPVVHDSEGALSKRFGVIGVPETYLVGADGEILWSARGPVSARITELRAAIGRLVGAHHARANAPTSPRPKKSERGHGDRRSFTLSD